MSGEWRLLGPEELIQEGDESRPPEERAEKAEAQAEIYRQETHRWKAALAKAEKERDEARLSLRLSLAESVLREKERDQLRAEIELHRKGEFDDSWQRQCEENNRLESENKRLREALRPFANLSVAGNSGLVPTVICCADIRAAQQALAAKGESHE